MVTTDVINADDFGVGIAAAEPAAPFNHVNGAIRANLHVHRANKSEARQKWIDLQNVAGVVQLHLLDELARPFVNEDGVIVIARQFAQGVEVGLVMIDRAAHRSVSASAIHLWE